jgi:hypothetical protein
MMNSPVHADHRDGAPLVTCDACETLETLALLALSAINAASPPCIDVPMSPPPRVTRSLRSSRSRQHVNAASRRVDGSSSSRYSTTFLRTKPSNTLAPNGNVPSVRSASCTWKLWCRRACVSRSVPELAGLLPPGDDDAPPPPPPGVPGVETPPGLLRAVLYKRMPGWSSKASVGVEKRRGRGLKARDGRRDTPGKVLKDRRPHRERGRMGTSV